MIPSLLLSLALMVQAPLAPVADPLVPWGVPALPEAVVDPPGGLSALPPHGAADEGGDGGAALRSLAAPGWGQRSQGRSHWWVYALAEGAIWAGVTHQRREGGRFRNDYRDLAWDVARAPFREGPRRDGSWSYYERMGSWRDSGRFDRTPGEAPLHPETDEGTFNGMVWRLAREIHLPSGGEGLDESDPAFQRALAYYRERAIPPELRWSWQGAEAELLRFRELVEKSDDAFRNGTAFMGVALLNRFISGAEAWIASRPGVLESVPLSIRTRVMPDPMGSGWGVHLRVTPGSAVVPGSGRP